MTRQMRRVLSQPARRIETPFQTKYGHVVKPDKSGCWYNVTSSRSAKTYRVRPTGGQSATCECTGFSHTGLPCSHIAAVIEFASIVLAEQAKRRYARKGRK